MFSIDIRGKKFYIPCCMGDMMQQDTNNLVLILLCMTRIYILTLYVILSSCVHVACI